MNASATTKNDNKEELPAHMQLVQAIPDAVHAAKKAFRASANWWLWVDGYRVNNGMLRCLRQFDKEAAWKLCPIISDSALRNRDRIDFGSIIELVSPELHNAVEELCNENGFLTTTTVVPDPFWKDKAKGILSPMLWQRNP